MKNWKLAPKDTELAKYVQWYWFLEKESSDSGHSWPKLYPDPATHLIVADNKHYFHYETETNLYSGCGSHLIFPHRNAFVMDHQKPFRILGIKFKVGAFYSLEHLNSLFDIDTIQAIDFGKLLGKKHAVVERLLSASAEEKVATRDLLDQILTPCVSKVSEDRHSELTRKVLPLLCTTSIAALGDKLHCAQRTVERSFLRTTGLTLKQCKSMFRLENLLSRLYKQDSKHIDWRTLAADYEFSDQPHLIRYLKSCINETPREYALKRDLTIDVYGSFEFT
ncbi:helix-turn-helix domain-containing protein [Agaribacter marinus]|uniref:HTH araC/xylS-type domain-containing protein n=1 Tax=Agaribacter marinus TaxID=1431249 RepID=A0AA37T0H9_9ALTE|nr:helix-turn-helix domain-containing protein [Agaribacter marinus]GLR70193.1 hypothetical protein GCM10007852_11010 [Agaribacter marinus]